MIEAMQQALETLTHKKWFRIGLVEPNDPKVEAAITALSAAIEAAEKQEPVQDQLAWKNLRNRIKADIDRTEGRWGMHGHSAVDNDYFTALEWVVERMDEILASAHRQPLIDVQLLEDAYLAGFMNSDEGHNGEYPFRYREENPLKDRRWVEAKNAYISAAIAAAKGEA